MRASFIGLTVLALVVVSAQAQVPSPATFDPRAQFNGQILPLSQQLQPALALEQFPSAGSIQMASAIAETSQQLEPAPVLDQPPPAGSVQMASVVAETSSTALSAPVVEETMLGTQSAYCGRSYVQVDGLFWHRAVSGCSTILALDTNTIPPRPVLDTTDPAFNVTGGVRVFVGWTPACCSRCSTFEVGYFGLYGSQATKSAFGNNSLTIPGDLGAASNNFLNADRITANYRSDLHNLEFNCVKSCCLCGDRVDFLCGLRFLNLNETFTLTGDDSADEGIGTYTVKTNNYLYGLQLGGRYTRCYCNWSVQLIGKAGVFVNDATQWQQVLDAPFNAGVPFQLRPAIAASGASVAGLGELGIVAIRPLNDTWSLRVGYNVLGIGGLALAPDQLDFTDVAGVSGSRLNTCGWVFFHGGLLGLQAAW
jgi:hypothetical protein